MECEIMGVDEKISSMNPKRKKLFETFIMIAIICTLLYFGLVLALILHFDFMAIFVHPVFAQTVVILVILGVAWKVLHGGKIVVPEPTKTTKPRTQCWKCNTEYEYTKNPFGDTTVKCPNCGSEGIVKK
jgi:hypothetical protein